MTQFSRGPLIAVVMALIIVTSTTVALANHAWGNYHWARTSNPFTLKLGDNVTSTWDSYLSQASIDWTQSSVLNTTIVPGLTTKNCRPTSGRIEVCNAKYGNNGWLGIAQIWLNGTGHITQATTKLNDTYFNTSKYNTPAWRRLVMCQEIAHDFGLDHQDENFSNPNLGSCMDYTSDPDGPLSNEHPNAHDYAQLELMYAHLDSTITVGSVTAPQAKSDVQDSDGPPQWGKVLRRDSTGRPSVFERDLGKGHTMITHVFWADGEGESH